MSLQEELKKRIRYCSYCGRRIVPELVDTGRFDRITGKKKYIIQYTCSKWRERGFLPPSSHDNYVIREPILVERICHPNTEVRRRLLRKLKLRRNVDYFVLDKKELKVGGLYELCFLELGERKRFFLKMINPSTGDCYIEWVPPIVRTVEEALLWRNGGVLPDVIS